MAKPPKRNDMSDMVHRIKTENAKGFPQSARVERALTGYDENGEPIWTEMNHFGDPRRYQKD